VLRYCTVIMATALLGGCGLGETVASAGAGGASAAQAAKEARATEDRVRKELEEAQRQAAEQRRAAEEAASQ